MYYSESKNQKEDNSFYTKKLNNIKFFTSCWISFTKENIGNWEFYKQNIYYKLTLSSFY